jgi:hypothetical protein
MPQYIYVQCVAMRCNRLHTARPGDTALDAADFLAGDEDCLDGQGGAGACIGEAGACLAGGGGTFLFLEGDRSRITLPPKLCRIITLRHRLQGMRGACDMHQQAVTAPTIMSARQHRSRPKAVPSWRLANSCLYLHPTSSLALLWHVGRKLCITCPCARCWCCFDGLFDASCIVACWIRQRAHAHPTARDTCT